MNIEGLAYKVLGTVLGIVVKTKAIVLLFYLKSFM